MEVNGAFAIHNGTQLPDEKLDNYAKILDLSFLCGRLLIVAVER